MKRTKFWMYMGIFLPMRIYTAAVAGVPYLPMPISRSIQRADAIVVAAVVGYSPDVGPTTELAPGDATSGKHVAAMFTFQPSGTYRFQLVQTVQGQCEPTFEAGLPFLSSRCYGYTGDTRFDLPNGAQVLLLLKRDDLKKWVAVDPCMPLIPLSGKGQVATPDKSDGSRKNVDCIDVLIPSLADLKIRAILVHILRDEKDDRVLEKLRPFIDDKDDNIAADALNCLAVNQEVSAIPKIAELERRRPGTGVVGALSFYTTPKAVEFLNPLILDEPDYMRLNAMTSLRPMADKTSIPFLMYALEHDDRQKTVSYDAYAALHRLVPSLGPPAMVDNFEKNRDAEISLLKQWWEWEQIKAKKAASATAPATSTQPTGK